MFFWLIPGVQGEEILYKKIKSKGNIKVIGNKNLFIPERQDRPGHWSNISHNPEVVKVEMSFREIYESFGRVSKCVLRGFDKEG